MSQPPVQLVTVSPPSCRFGVLSFSPMMAQTFMHFVGVTGIGGTGQDLRCKTRTLTKKPTKPSDL